MLNPGRRPRGFCETILRPWGPPGVPGGTSPALEDTLPALTRPPMGPCGPIPGVGDGENIRLERLLPDRGVVGKRPGRGVTFLCAGDCGRGREGRPKGFLGGWRGDEAVGSAGEVTTDGVSDLTEDPEWRRTALDSGRKIPE